MTLSGLALAYATSSLTVFAGKSLRIESTFGPFASSEIGTNCAGLIVDVAVEQIGDGQRQRRADQQGVAVGRGARHLLGAGVQPARIVLDNDG